VVLLSVGAGWDPLSVCLALVSTVVAPVVACVCDVLVPSGAILVGVVVVAVSGCASSWGSVLVGVASSSVSFCVGDVSVACVSPLFCVVLLLVVVVVAKLGVGSALEGRGCSVFGKSVCLPFPIGFSSGVFLVGEAVLVGVGFPWGFKPALSGAGVGVRFRTFASFSFLTCSWCFV